MCDLNTLMMKCTSPLNLCKMEIYRNFDGKCQYDLNDIRFHLLMNEHTDASTPSAIEYVRKMCKRCYVETRKCKRCELHDLMLAHVKTKLFQPYVYRNLRDYGNCYISQTSKLTEEQIFDLKVFGFPNIKVEKAKLTGGQIISVEGVLI